MRKFNVKKFTNHRKTHRLIDRSDAHYFPVNPRMRTCMAGGVAGHILERLLRLPIIHAKVLLRRSNLFILPSCSLLIIVRSGVDGDHSLTMSLHFLTAL